MIRVLGLVCLLGVGAVWGAGNSEDLFWSGFTERLQKAQGEIDQLKAEGKLSEEEVMAVSNARNCIAGIEKTFGNLKAAEKYTPELLATALTEMEGGKVEDYLEQLKGLSHEELKGVAHRIIGQGNSLNYTLGSQLIFMPKRIKQQADFVPLLKGKNEK